MANPKDDDPNGTKALQKAVDEARAAAAKAQAETAQVRTEKAREIEGLKAKHADELGKVRQKVVDAEEAAGRAIAAGVAAVENRDLWLARMERAQRGIQAAMDALNGVDPEPEAEGDGG